MSHPAPNTVGVRVLSWTDERPEAKSFSGVSYCEAVRRAARGETLIVQPGSIQVCRWAPVALGLKRPESRFEEHIEPRLPFPTPGLLLAPLDRFPGEPQVVIVQAPQPTLQELICNSRQAVLWDGHEDRVDRSALTLFDRPNPPARHRVIGAVNRPLAILARSARWRALTHWLFRSQLVTVAFDALISRMLADMSVCRNSTVIPLLTGQANVSHFCTGGITWGRNRPDYLTSGWPFPIFSRLPAMPSLHSRPGNGSLADGLIRKAGGSR